MGQEKESHCQGMGYQHSLGSTAPVLSWESTPFKELDWWAWRREGNAQLPLWLPGLSMEKVWGGDGSLSHPCLTGGAGSSLCFQSIISEIGTQQEEEVAEVVVAVFSTTKPLCSVLSQVCGHGCKKSEDRRGLSDGLVLTPEI